MTLPNASPITDILLGTDLVFVPRLEKILSRFGEPFCARLLTQAEWDYCRNEKTKIMRQRLAARIAAKEAVAKALGTGLNGLGWNQGIGWREVEVISHSQSPPTLKLSGRALQLAGQRGIRDWRLSLSHDGDYALATVFGLV